MNNDKIKEMIAVQQEIIPVEQGRLGLMVDARLLHEKMYVQTKYADWIKRRIDEYGFVENEDYEVFLKFEKNLSGGRPSQEYYITLDMAKELAMVEKNHFGRAVRKYFIAVEKQYRDWIGFVLPRLYKDIDLFGERLGYDYLQLLKAVGLSVGRGAAWSRRRKNPQEFWMTGGTVFVSEEYGKNIIAYAAARKLSREMSMRRINWHNHKL